jgi:hypothetical protein
MNPRGFSDEVTVYQTADLPALAPPATISREIGAGFAWQRASGKALSKCLGESARQFQTVPFPRQPRSAHRNIRSNCPQNRLAGWNCSCARQFVLNIHDFVFASARKYLAQDVTF